MTYQSNMMLEQLQAETRELIRQTQLLLQKDPEWLMKSPGPGKWSVAQVIEHLNSYNRYYLKAIAEAIKSDHQKLSLEFKPGWLGDFFTRSMRPKANGSIGYKMQSPKDHRPGSDPDSIVVIQEFLNGGHELLGLLEEAKRKNIGRIRIPITLSRFIRLKLGDTFRFLLAHQQRHFLQIDRTLTAIIPKSSSKNVQQAIG